MNYPVLSAHACFMVICVFLFPYSIQPKLPQFNNFTTDSTPLCIVYLYIASVAGSVKVTVVLSNLLL